MFVSSLWNTKRECNYSAPLELVNEGLNTFEKEQRLVFLLGP